MDILKTIKNRRTVREYTQKKVPIGIIKDIVDAGRWAPSAHNIQPWKFVVVTKADVIREIAKIFNKKASALLAGFNIIMRETAKKIEKSPCVMLVYNDKSITKRMEKFGAPYTEIAKIYETQSIAAAIQNMLLLIQSKKYGAAWLGIALLCASEINGIVKQKDELMALISIGAPIKKTKVSLRKDIKQIFEVLV